MAGRGRRGIAAGLALLFGREVAKRRRAKAKPAETEAERPEVPPAEVERLRGELREELERRQARS